MIDAALSFNTTTAQYTNAIWIGEHSVFSTQLLFTTINSNIHIQVSNDAGTPATDPGNLGVPTSTGVSNWTSYAGTTQTVSSASGDHGYNFTGVGFKWFRVAFHPVSAIGTLTSARFYAKGN